MAAKRFGKAPEGPQGEAKLAGLTIGDSLAAKKVRAAGFFAWQIEDQPAEPRPTKTRQEKV